MTNNPFKATKNPGHDLNDVVVVTKCTSVSTDGSLIIILSTTGTA